jgi:TPR repeat protein
MYESGNGVPQDDVEAVRWYRLASEQGDSFAQVNLGNSYYTGKGVPQDNLSGLMWWAIAGAQGVQDANTNVDILAEEMSKTDYLEGLKRAQACLASNYQDCD